MPVGPMSQGMAEYLSNYIASERQRQRDVEDAQLDHHTALIQALANRPDANPALLGQALHDMVELQNAKGGQGKLKGGAAGFMGSHELPISQFLQGVQDHVRPIVGPTSEAVPMPATPQQQGLLQPAQPMQPQLHELGGGAPPMLPAPPIDTPPTEGLNDNLISAAQGVAKYNAGPKTRPLPQDKQPYFRSQDELATEEGNAAGVKAGAIGKAQRGAERDAALEAGLTEEEYAQTLKDKLRGRATPALQDADGGLWQDSQGNLIRARNIFDPNTGRTKLVNSTTGLSLTPDMHPYEKPLTPPNEETTDIKDFNFGNAHPEFKAWQKEQANLKAVKPSTINVNSSGLTPNQQVNALNKLQTAWNKSSTAANTMVNQYNLMQAGMQAARRGDLNAGSQAILVTFQKILDPNSVVRESEYDRSPEGLSIKDRINGWIQKQQVGGPGVPIEKLEEFARVAKQFIDGVQNSTNVGRKQIEAGAKLAGLDPQQVFGTETGLTTVNDTGNTSIPPPPGAPKTISKALVQQYATEHKVDYNTAAQQFIAKQYTIQ